MGKPDNGHLFSIKPWKCKENLCISDCSLIFLFKYLGHSDSRFYLCKKRKTMRKIIFSIFLSLLPLSVFSQKETVSLVDVKNLSVPHGSCVPNVTTDGDDIIIKSDSLLTDVTVVVKNQNGEVMHVSSETIDKVGATITVPNADVSEPATIDLYYDDKHLRGELAK